MKTVVILLALVCFIMSMKCPVKHFKLPGMLSCHPYLNCSDIEEFKTIKELRSGFVKSVYLTKWKRYNVVLAKPKNSEFIKDFENGLFMLELMNPSDVVVQLIGFCRESNTILTEYHSHGDATRLLQILNDGNRSADTLEQRLQFCINYAEILQFLHDGPLGTRVACDSNDLEKLLSQFLITSDLRLILNDVDALPEVIKNGTVLCGTRKLTGDFIAPEQRATAASVIGYNEKTDIWKAASVCQYFLQDHSEGQIVLYHLFDMHKKCKSKNPTQRPTAKELVEHYKDVLNELLLSRSEL